MPQTWRRVSTLLITLACFLGAALQTGCSPGSFFGEGKDQGLAQQQGYRRINTACSGIQMGAHLTVPELRSMVHCLNAYGGIDALDRLVQQLSDSEAQSLVDVANHYVLDDHKRFYEIQQTILTLKDENRLDNTFYQLGRVLENEQFIASAIAVMRNAYEGADRAKILHAFERLSRKVTATESADALDAALTLASSNAFPALLSRFNGPSPSGRTLYDLIARVQSFITDQSDPNRVEVGRELLMAIVDGDGNLFRALDEVTGTTAGELQRNMPLVTSVMKATMQRGARQDGKVVDAALLDDMTSLFHYLNGPLSCLGGAKSIPNLDQWVVRELTSQNTATIADYIRRENPLIAVAMNPFCSYPEQLGEYYPSMIRLSDSSAVQPATDLLKSFYRNNLSGLLIRILSDTGSKGVPGVPENTGRIKTILPLLSELTERGVWDDLFLTLALPRIEDRERLVSELRFLMQGVPELGGWSVYDVLADAVSKASVTDLFYLARSIGPFLSPEEPPLLVPALSGIRSAYYVNDVHPFVGVLHDVMQDASANQALFDTLFHISEMPEFQDSIQLLSKMGKDGQLKDLTYAIVQLFSGLTQGGEHEIHRTKEPGFVPERRHNLSSADLDLSGPAQKPWDDTDPCRKLDTRINMGDYNGDGFDEQLTNYLGCINEDHEHGDVVTAVNFMRAEKVQDGRSFFNLMIDLVKEMRLGVREMGDLADRWIRSVDDMRFYHLMDALPFWVSKRFGAKAGASAAGPVLRPLFDVLGPVTGAVTSENVPAVRKFLDLASSIVAMDDLPNILSYAERIAGLTPDPTPAPPPEGFDLARIARDVEKYECVQNPTLALQSARKIVDNYNDAITNWDLVEGEPRRSWTKEKFKSALEPVFQKFADPSQNMPEKNVLDGLLNTVRLFTLPAGAKPNPYQRYHRDDLVQFLLPRSKDYRAILYYYPGENQPRVRLVNSLDRLELVVINADLQFILPDNFGLKFLGMLAEAYGDEPYESWPEEIKRKYPPGSGKRPLTLKEAYDQMVKTENLFSKLVGYPELETCTPHDGPVFDPSNPADRPYEIELDRLPTSGAPGWVVDPTDPNKSIRDVKRAVFNIAQVIPVLKENLPAPYGTPESAGGLRVLRDLLWEMYSSTPPRFRNPRAGERNNLRVAIDLVRMGFLRQVGRQMRQFELGDPTLDDFFQSLIDGAMTPEITDVAHELLIKHRGHRLIWKLLDTLMDVTDTPEDTAFVKQLAFYLIGSASPDVTGLPAEQSLIQPVLANLDLAVKNHYDFLTSNADLAGDALQSHRISEMVRAFYEDPMSADKARVSKLLLDVLQDSHRADDLLTLAQAVSDDETAHQGWKTFRSRMDVMTGEDGYKQLNLPDIGKDVLHFFEAVPSPAEPQTAPDLREYLARVLASQNGGASPGELEEVLDLAARKPDEVYQVLEMFSHYTENGELKDFVRLARRSLSEPPR